MGEVGIESQALREQWRERLRWWGAPGPMPPWLDLLLHGTPMVPAPGFFETAWARAQTILARHVNASVLLDRDLRMHELAEREFNDQLAPFGIRVARDVDGRRPDLSGPNATIYFEPNDTPQREPLPDVIWFSPFEEPPR